MGVRHGWRVGVIALGVAAASVAVLVAGCGRTSVETDVLRVPIAVVLMPKEGRTQELAVVDLDRFEVSKRIPLRSVALSIDGDPETRTVVTAQGGRPDKHDSVLGVVDLVRGKVDYVETGLENPDTVVLNGDKAFIMHGLFDGVGLLTSVVDVGKRSLLAHGRVHDLSGRPEGFSGSVLVPVSGRTNSPAEPGSLDTADAEGDTSEVVPLPYSAVVVLSGGSGPFALVAGRVQEPGLPGKWEIAEVDVESKRVVRRVEVPEVTRGVIAGCVTNEFVALCDDDGMDPDSPGHNVLLLDRRTLRTQRTIRLEGAPSDVDAWGEQLVVTDGKKGEVLLFSKGGSGPVKRVKVADRGLLAADTVVFSTAPRNVSEPR